MALCSVRAATLAEPLHKRVTTHLTLAPLMRRRWLQGRVCGFTGILSCFRPSWWLCYLDDFVHCMQTIFIVMISCITFEGDVYSEEILFLTGLLPGEVTWRFFLPYWGTHSCMTSKAAFPCCPLICMMCAVRFLHRRMAMTTVTCQTTMKQTGGKMLWLNPASCS